MMGEMAAGRVLQRAAGSMPAMQPVTQDFRGHKPRDASASTRGRLEASRRISA